MKTRFRREKQSRTLLGSVYERTNGGSDVGAAVSHLRVQAQTSLYAPICLPAPFRPAKNRYFFAVSLICDPLFMTDQLR
jgi:hypothetical protein